MTTNDPRSTDVGALLTAWFEADAQTREPDGLVDAALARTARVRPLPAWRLPERWIPMQLAMQRTTVAKAVPILVVLALLIALAVGLLLIGVGRPGPSLPLPDGLAGNGRLVYVVGGNLVSANDGGVDVRPLIDSDRILGEPVWSLDGTKFAFKAYTDPASSRQASVMVADADGTNQVTIAADVWDASVPSWSRDGRNLLLAYSTEGTDLSERLYVAPADGSTPPARLAHDPGFAVGRELLARRHADRLRDRHLRRRPGALVGQAGWVGCAQVDHWPLLRHRRRSSTEASASFGSRTAPPSCSLPATNRPTTSMSSASQRGRRTPPIATSPLNEYGATYAPDGRSISYLAAPRYQLATLMVANSDGSNAHPAVDGSHAKVRVVHAALVTGRQVRDRDDRCSERRISRTRSGSSTPHPARSTPRSPSRRSLGRSTGNRAGPMSSGSSASPPDRGRVTPTTGPALAQAGRSRSPSLAKS